jgi:ABC-type dipeptide/oligopeptide/nickel transport systems, permease components
MGHYIVKRLLQGVLLIIASSIVIFSLLYMMPGDPLEALVGDKVSEQRKEEYRVEYGLDKPAYIQYLNWVGKLMKGDMGLSLKSKMPVSKMLSQRIPVTLRLCGIALLIQLLLSVPIGLLMAYKKNTIIDKVFMAITMFFSAIPSFWIAILLMLILGVKLRWLPVTGFTSWKNYIMPIMAMVLGGCASTIRLTRSEVLEVVHEKFVVTAYAKGLDKKTVMIKHVLRNALILVVVMTFLSLPWIIAGSVVIEFIFGIPGMGLLLTNSILSRDFPIVQSIILIISFLTVIANIMSDIVTALLDPRIMTSINSEN